MGVQVNALEDPESKLVQAFHEYVITNKTQFGLIKIKKKTLYSASYVVYQRIFSPWKRFDWLFPFSREYQINRKACNLLHAFNHEVRLSMNKEIQINS